MVTVVRERAEVRIKQRKMNSVVGITKNETILSLDGEDILRFEHLTSDLEAEYKIRKYFKVLQSIAK